MIRFALAVLTILAALGLILGAAAHLLTFAGVNPQEIPGIWLLHLGIFAVIVPAIFIGRSLGRDIGEVAIWQYYTPRWLKTLTTLLFVYAFFNFFWSNSLNEGGIPAELRGDLVLHNHGKVIRKLTPAEFAKHRAYSLRSFSGHWMVFYAAGLMLLVGCGNAARAVDRRVALDSQLLTTDSL